MYLCDVCMRCICHMSHRTESEPGNDAILKSSVRSRLSAAYRRQFKWFGVANATYHVSWPIALRSALVDWANGDGDGDSALGVLHNSSNSYLNLSSCPCARYFEKRAVVKYGYNRAVFVGLSRKKGARACYWLPPAKPGFIISQFCQVVTVAIVWQPQRNFLHTNTCPVFRIPKDTSCHDSMQQKIEQELVWHHRDTVQQIVNAHASKHTYVQISMVGIPFLQQITLWCVMSRRSRRIELDVQHCPTPGADRTSLGKITPCHQPWSVRHYSSILEHRCLIVLGVIVSRGLSGYDVLFPEFWERNATTASWQLTHGVSFKHCLGHGR